MRVPQSLEALVDQGVITEVVRPLMSGKEAQVYLVESGGELRVAKVYKEASNRSFKHRADYTEGRKVRNTRKQRAMNKRSKYGREEIEAAWRNAEVDAIYKLRAAGVRVPEPFDFLDGVLVMEFVTLDGESPAPRLVDLELEPGEAKELFQTLLGEVIKMLCAGVVHGDLSDFNVLKGPNGPVIIDFPQWVDPAQNRSARKLLIRDVDNLTSFLARSARGLRGKPYGAEMWDLFERNELTPETRLSGRYKDRRKKADTNALLAEIEALEEESRKRREALGLPPPRPARQPIAAQKRLRPIAESDRGEKKSRKRRRRKKPPRDRPRSEEPRREDRTKRSGGSKVSERTKDRGGKKELPDLDDLDAFLIVED